MKIKITLTCILAVLLIVQQSTAQTITSNQTGNQGGYWYTFWKDSPGSVSMTLGSGGQFSVSWSNVGNFVCGKGWSTGSTSRTITYSRSGSAQYIGVYGWMTNPLVEYYIGQHSGGSSRGTYSADGTTYTLYVDNRNGPNIQGSGPFQQYNAVGGGTSVNFGQHVSGWQSRGVSVGTQNYQVVAIEGWNSSGNASVTVGSGGSSSSSSSGGSSSGGSRTVTVRARGTSGQESITLRVNNQNVQTWTLTTSMVNRSASTSLTGGITVAFTNDASGRDVQIDYIQVNGVTRQSESQSYNTGVWQNNQCGGSYSEWLHCNGAIGYGNISKEAADEEQSVEALPTEYALRQNYPNPFNPATNIKYSLPQAGFVKLTVYDLIGREVQTLVNMEQPAGTHTAVFDAENIPSGVYFYTLQTNGLSFSKKMILMK
jgi:endo-1,4-beta-xylanase